jgi:YVTN family beta-propeller protein
MAHNRIMITRRALVGGTLALAACSPPKGTGFPGFAIIASEAEHTLSAISLEHFRVTRQLHLEAAPSQVTAISHPQLVLCLLPSRGTLIAVDSGAVAVRQKVRVGDESLTMCLDDDGKRVWVLNKSPNSLVAVDLATFKIAARVHLPGEPLSADFRYKTGAVSLPRQGAIAIVEGDRVARTIAAGIAPGMICFRPDGKAVLAADSEAQMLAVADPAAGKLLVKLALPLKPRRYCYNSDGGQLFITGDGMDAVTIVSPYQTEVFATILAGNSPSGMAVPRPDPDLPEYLLVTNSGSGDLTVISIFSRGVVARIPVGQDPQDVIITPDNQYALVLNRQSGDVAVIRVPSIGAWGNHHKKTAPLFTMIPVGTRPISATISRVV